MEFKKSLLASGLCILALAVAGCGGNGDDDDNNTAQQSNVRFFNTLNNTNAAAGNVSLNVGATAVSNSTTGQFGQFTPSGSYTSVESGAATVTGSGGGLTTNIQPSGPVSLSSNQYYTLVAAGQIGQTGQFAPQVLLIPEFNPNLQTIGTGQTAIRVVNLSPTTETYTLFNSQSGGPAAVLDTGTSGITYGAPGTGSYVLLNTSGLGSLSLRNATDPNQDVTLANSNLTNFTFQSGRAYTIYVYGMAGTTQGLNAFITQDYPPVTSSVL